MLRTRSCSTTRGQRICIEPIGSVGGRCQCPTSARGRQHLLTRNRPPDGVDARPEKGRGQFDVGLPGSVKGRSVTPGIRHAVTYGNASVLALVGCRSWANLAAQFSQSICAVYLDRQELVTAVTWSVPWPLCPLTSILAFLACKPGVLRLHHRHHEAAARYGPTSIRPSPFASPAQLRTTTSMR